MSLRQIQLFSLECSIRESYLKVIEWFNQVNNKSVETNLTNCIFLLFIKIHVNRERERVL